VFAFLYRPEERTDIESHPQSRFFVNTISYRVDSHSIIEDFIYAPIGAAVRRISLRARALQSGNVHSYLLYILLTLLALLLFAK
jgi:hydrogenase-4 component B